MSAATRPNARVRWDERAGMYRATCEQCLAEFWTSAHRYRSGQAPGQDEVGVWEAISLHEQTCQGRWWK